MALRHDDLAGAGRLREHFPVRRAFGGDRRPPVGGVVRTLPDEGVGGERRRLGARTCRRQSDSKADDDQRYPRRSSGPRREGPHVRYSPYPGPRSGRPGRSVVMRAVRDDARGR